ncbi:MAG: hypothetical protein GY847_12520 [Proteobacteria bacterium]|nr:hypothetical protein [Pseudomonadota bacterium]
MIRKGGELCDDCVSSDDCQVRLQLMRPILDCEKYRKNNETTEAHDEDTAAHGKGLCTTCAIQENCSQRRVEGGVWHCADYC